MHVVHATNVHKVSCVGRELDARRKKEEELKKALLSKKTERTQIEEKYVSLQEMAAVKSAEAGRLKKHLHDLKMEVHDLREVGRVKGAVLCGLVKASCWMW